MNFPLGKPPTVLLVDDDVEMREDLAALLAERGYALKQAPNGVIALKMMLEKRPDAVVLDLGMPVMDGYEMLRRMRAHPDLRKLYVIVASGLGAARDRELAFEAGCNELIVKPYKAEQLASALTTYFVRHGSVTV
ncbi:MAG: hypothetical protein JWP97_1588 [Labilithrix sp.]|nr:hypothetical protein [Labilithrix sp.]